ncbi:Os12g0531500 [Oryza sativa Japonica Group]|uniref:Os12g0531500 protein n=1 Tax=Oryza sativa subsp. japonica TaxID=39947 RepID=C7J9I4_ORYSJ|nr:Os12g0531500 [Oryza sativa Japonica Group]|eukprot:NP_001176989.1 Os12g0531500 [Oryza sativa Japonica Group]
MCSEVLGFESGGSHVTMDILPHEVSEPESNLLDINEKRRLAKESRPPLPPAMPWRGKRIVLDRYDGRLIMSQVPTKLPFTLHASRVDGRLRLSCMHPSDSVDELKVASNGKKDVEDHAKGNHGEKNVDVQSTSLSDRGNLDRVWRKMRETFRKFSDTEYKCMLTSLTRFGDIAEAESFYSEWESASGTRDSRIPNTILAFYIKNGMMEKAEGFLDHIVQKGVKPSYSTWELFVWGYLSDGRMDKVLECLKKALSCLEKWDPNPQLATAIYSQIEEKGDIEAAEKLLVMFREAGYVTTEIYNSVLRTYAKAELMPLIVDERMDQDKVSMDDETRSLLRLTSKYPIGEVSTLMS